MHSTSLIYYNTHIRGSIDWILRSVDAGGGGSSAYYSSLLGWSAPYPETSGYIIPTLLNASNELDDRSLEVVAIKVGEWLLTLQSKDGWWPCGLYKSRSSKSGPSVFNTGQIIDGMVALASHTGDSRWSIAAIRAANWLADAVDEQGLWSIGNYRKGSNPSYYTHVAWPMLLAWRLGASESIRDAAIRVLQRIIALRTPKGVFRGWSFDSDKPAFTHTIAYTLRGFIECAVLLEDWHSFGAPCEAALDRLARKAEFTHGRLPGAYSEEWKPINWYTCLTGNAQIAICLLRMEQHSPDLRLVNAAEKLISNVCNHQRINSGRTKIRGAISGSAPLWGRYMFMRYPNWAVKYHADALMMLSHRLKTEGLQ